MGYGYWLSMELGKTLILTHHSRLGDPVLSIPLHRALAPICDLHSNVGDRYRSIFHLSGVHPTWTDELQPKSFGEILRTARALREQRFRTIFLIRPSFRAALLARLAGIPVRVGEASEGRGFLLTHKVPYSATRNELDHLSTLAGLVGVDVKREWNFQPSGDVVQRIRAELGSATIGIVPGVSWHGKAVPTEIWRDVIQKLQGSGHACALLGGPGDNRYADQLADTGAIHLGERFDLEGLIAAFQSLKVVAAADGGLYHLSVASGTPTVGIFGPTSSKRWGHDWGDNVTIQSPENSNDKLHPNTLLDAIESRL